MVWFIVLAIVFMAVILATCVLAAVMLSSRISWAERDQPSESDPDR